MKLADKYLFLEQEAVVEVRAEALTDEFRQKGGDDGSEVEGYEGTWRRATVVDHKNKEKADQQRWVIIQLVEGQAMYKNWKPLGKAKAPPLPFDDTEDMEESEDEEDDYTPAQFLVAPVHVRPWRPFSDIDVWPPLDIEQLRVGHAVLYVDGLDSCARWCCWVRRVFQDGVWLWVKGPAPGMPPWAPENHHVSCCRRSSPCWRATFGRERPLYPLEDHLRRDAAYDLESGRWEQVEARVYFDPLWQVGGHITGHCPSTRHAHRLHPDEVAARRMRAAMTIVGDAIADGALPEELQRFVRSFDAAACAAAGPEEEEGDAQAIAAMTKDPCFHDTFCGFLLDSLRQPSPVSHVGVAVFEQIKETFKEDAAALHKHMAREFVKAHFL